MKGGASPRIKGPVPNNAPPPALSHLKQPAVSSVTPSQYQMALYHTRREVVVARTKTPYGLIGQN